MKLEISTESHWLSLIAHAVSECKNVDYVNQVGDYSLHVYMSWMGQNTYEIEELLAKDFPSLPYILYADDHYENFEGGYYVLHPGHLDNVPIEEMLDSTGEYRWANAGNGEVMTIDLYSLYNDYKYGNETLLRSAIKVWETYIYMIKHFHETKRAFDGHRPHAV